eukprot:TRINITY_DN22382_c0_g1_i1.p1 TRINITY_DN22382_c0_g1~~TRINITY_DN22382_c0_g1_i1.p1  ORF type:complete len:327 (-),score=61.30 TRINITY_DN22382_c0_g1_i1:305-1285(-)
MASRQQQKPVADFIKEDIGPVLFPCLEELCRKQPDKPLQWLAASLMRNNPNRSEGNHNASSGSITPSAASATSSDSARSSSPSPRRVINVVFIGPPACGKGTQASNLIHTYGMKQYSTGDILRGVVKRAKEGDVDEKTAELAGRLKEIMENGQLVPDDIILELLKEQLLKDRSTSTSGFLLDGFPRTLNQAQMLDDILQSEGILKKGDLLLVFELHVPDDALIERACGRRTHVPSGRIYHVKYNPPKVEGKDDETGEDLVQREDDKDETVLNRRYFAWSRQTCEGRRCGREDGRTCWKTKGNYGERTACAGRYYFRTLEGTTSQRS